MCSLLEYFRFFLHMQHAVQTAKLAVLPVIDADTSPVTEQEHAGGTPQI